MAFSIHWMTTENMRENNCPFRRMNRIHIIISETCSLHLRFFVYITFDACMRLKWKATNVKYVFIMCWERFLCSRYAWARNHYSASNTRYNYNCCVETMIRTKRFSSHLFLFIYLFISSFVLHLNYTYSNYVPVHGKKNLLLFHTLLQCIKLICYFAFWFAF